MSLFKRKYFSLKMPCLNLPNDMQIFGKLMNQPFGKISMKWIFIAFEFMLSADVPYVYIYYAADR